MGGDLSAELSGIEGAVLERNVPASRLTTWKVGGPVSWLLDVNTASALASAITTSARRGLALMVIGNGSNLLVSDEGFEGLMIRLRGDLASVNATGSDLSMGAGASLNSSVSCACEAGLSGLEFAAGIPGTAGGAVMMNAGAYGGCMADVVAGIEGLNPRGEAVEIESFESAYRSGLAPGDVAVTRVVLRLAPGDIEEIRRDIKEIFSRRRRTQPLDAASAGSVFKNPEGKHAGWLVEMCGLKGTRVGGARISEVHGNFIVNEGGAAARDIVRLMEIMASEVEARHGIKLEPEVRPVGFKEEGL